MSSSLRSGKGNPEVSPPRRGSTVDLVKDLARLRDADPAKFPSAYAKLKQILERQQARGGPDNVPYVLGRTVSSCIQHNAAKALGATGVGSQCPRGACMARAMDTFAEKGVERIPREVV